MAGAGGDAPPRMTGGEFLLQLLQNPPHQQPPPPSQALSHDPAVAAVGPTLPFPPFASNGHDLPSRPPWPHSPPPPPSFAPHNFFVQGFPQNPNPNPSPNWSSPPQPPPGFNHSNQRNIQYNDYNPNSLGDDIRKLGFFDTNPKPNSAHHRQEHNLMFGSLPCKIRNNNEGPSNGNSYDNPATTGGKLEGLLSEERDKGLGNLRLNGLEVEFRNSHEFNRIQQVNSHAFRKNEQKRGNRGGTGSGTQQTRPPPGFPGKLGNASSSFERDVDKGKSKFGKLNHRAVASNNVEGGERVLYPDLAEGGGRIEDSALELHYEDGDLGQSELDDSEEQLIGTVSDEKKDRKKNHNSREKDYRSDKRGQWLLGQRMRNFKRLIECRSDIDRLNAPFLEIYESLIPAEEEKVKQKQLLTLLEKHVTNEWPDARLFLYGSCANSFGFTKSDIDVCLTIEDADVTKSEILLKLADILQSDNLQNVQALTRARVPIVKLMDPATGISCDICVNNVLAVVNTKLLRDYAQIDVRLRQLAFIVKHWAKSRGVNETYQGTLSSYAYVLMCIHFLQQRRPAILPCLQGMERTYAVTFENVECAYFDQVEKLSGFGSRNGESISRLVWAFFNYWAYCHDYANDVISIRTGSILSKRMKDWTRRIGNDRHLICIEDPFEVSHDLGRVVDKYSIRVLREEFERAAEIMQYDPNPCVTLFEPYVPS